MKNLKQVVYYPWIQPNDNFLAIIYFPLEKLTWAILNEPRIELCMPPEFEFSTTQHLNECVVRLEQTEWGPKVQ